MDNCDLEKLSVSGGKLHPAFSPGVTDYTVTVESSVSKVTLDLLTSDCGASYSVVSAIVLQLCHVHMVHSPDLTSSFLYISAVW